MAGGGPFGAAASSAGAPHLPRAVRAVHLPSKGLLSPGYAQGGCGDSLRIGIASWPSWINPRRKSPLIHRYLFLEHAQGGYGREDVWGRGTPCQYTVRNSAFASCTARINTESCFASTNGRHVLFDRKPTPALGKGAPCQCIVQNSMFASCAARISTERCLELTNSQVLFDQTRTPPLQFVPSAKSCSSDSLSAAADDNVVDDDGHSHAWNLPLSHTLPLIKPFLLSQWYLILKAWACTVVSVVALFLFIPQTGQLSGLVGKGDLPNLVWKCVLMAALLATRSVAQFYQQSLLWEVALRVTYDIRCHVFKIVLRNDLEYFESRDGVPAGDLVFRVTSEAADTGDSVYSFLETLIPSTLQLIAMSARMILLSPLLSVVTILVRVVKM